MKAVGVWDSSDPSLDDSPCLHLEYESARRDAGWHYWGGKKQKRIPQKMYALECNGQYFLLNPVHVNPH